MKSADLPLLLASDCAAEGQDKFPLDRIRMQKAIFLLTQRGSEGWRDLYTYRPYDWGPYSRALASDIDVLIETGNLEIEPFSGNRYGSYTATDSGEQRATQVWSRLDAHEKTFVRNVRKYVTSASFNKLLREVYAAYPEFATKSRFQS